MLKKYFVKGLFSILALTIIIGVITYIVNTNKNSETENTAYNLWLSVGGEGSKDDFMSWIETSLREKKDNNTNEEAYSIWISQGNQGTMDDFLSWLKNINNIKNKEDINDAYLYWLNLGNRGSKIDFLNWVQSFSSKTNIIAKEEAYNLWVSQGNRGTMSEFLSWLKNILNTSGEKVNTSYLTWLSEGNNGSEDDFLAWIKEQSKGEEEKEAIYDSVQFTSLEVEYNGLPQEIKISNLPTGVEVQYANNIATDIGVYRAFAYLYREDLGEKLLSATLTITKTNIKDITFADASFIYDGSEKQIEVAGNIPQGAQVKYFLNDAPFVGVKDVGTYNIKAILSGGNYNDLILNATLSVTKANIDGLSFNDRTFTYDGTTKNITLNGSLPSGTSVRYSDYTGNEFKGAVIPGIYFLKAIVTGSNYNTLELQATLTITKADINGITFNEYSTIYDGSTQNIKINGSLPVGVEVKYTLDTEEGPLFTGESEVGVYNIVVTISGEYYNKLILKAKLIIAPTRLNTVVNVNLYEMPVVGGFIGSPTMMISWDEVEDAGSYNIYLYFLDGNLAAMINVAGTTHDLRAEFWDLICRDNYKVEVVAMPNPGDANYAPSLPSDPANYKHIGKLYAPQNIRVEDEILKWDAVAEAQAYYIRVFSYNSNGQVISVTGGYIFDGKEIQTPLADLVRVLDLEPGNYRFTVKASTLSGIAWSIAYESSYGNYTELTRIE